MQHTWSGWPGAYCLVCGAEDAVENALALGWLNPSLYTNVDEWDTAEHKQMVEIAQNNCPGRKHE